MMQYHAEFLNNLITYIPFPFFPEFLKKTFSRSMYSITLCFLKLFICYAICWNFNFAVNLVTSFSLQKPLKSKKKNIGFFGIQSSTILQSLSSNK